MPKIVSPIRKFILNASVAKSPMVELANIRKTEKIQLASEIDDERTTA